MPYELFQYSPEDEHNLIKTYYARLNRCLVDAGDDPVDPAIDSAALIRSERLALRQLQTDPSSAVSIPERAMLGVADGTAEQRRCSDAAYDSLRTASGRAFDEDPIEAVEAAVEISARVANGLEPHQADWSNCMRDAGFPDARMSSWTNAAPAWTAADEHCRATSGYNERKVELLASNTKQWAIENAELIEVLLSEMDLVVQQAETLP
ncbi:MAG: hypothetical protein CL424_09925 [Acidimicrobiaceae bacterium]|nr:hypothetical protein [Acidimicrobiaceae bacterium]